ncbi:hypothetical protein OIU78_027710 [Salix suchowensis]|nr:hypothetical protein OIU78_027710 [Salix suchowensis]
MSGHGENAADSIVADAINDEVGYHADGNEYIDSADNGFDESEVDRPENVREALNEVDDDYGSDNGRNRRLDTVVENLLGEIFYFEFESFRRIFRQHFRYCFYLKEEEEEEEEEEEICIFEAEGSSGSVPTANTAGLGSMDSFLRIIKWSKKYTTVEPCNIL